ncbi:MAG TPA: hypothetical protein VEZ55_11865 [Chitinophagaceae bacterium]|nr:hypothetical protein [Chitinophagaceae bacterium]
MDIISFKETLSGSEPPTDMSIHLQSLWFDAKGEWQRAHEVIQDEPDKDSAWIHAYLHRREGDIWNADYWYRRAGKKRPDISLQQEWDQIVTALL